jgi:K+-transporting ATPase KdpF subunit
VGFYQGIGAYVDAGGFMEYAIAGIVSVGLFFYLLYALIRPERF